MPRITTNSTDENIPDQIDDFSENLPKSISKAARELAEIWDVAVQELAKGSLSESTNEKLLKAVSKLQGVGYEIAGRTTLITKFMRRAIEEKVTTKGGGPGWPPC